ncbi:MAG: glycoside hydrolase family 57 [Nitrospinae bacterium]|nr:glycoside hydrolase family 57 [Nitrospinota bacterium]
MNPLRLYAVFHLNIAYSSIEEEDRPAVIRRCYWPLLAMARDFQLPIGIEASGYTLEVIAQIDPAWLTELRQLTTTGPCEFLGSGYAQLIGPLVPAEVNATNLRLGHQVYERLLGSRPSTALVNEQAYSAGILRHYLDAGYQAIMMEWDNPARNHPEWDSEYRYFPQYACGQHGEVIPLIWNKSIAFQKFQRYAHGELTLVEYLEYLAGHRSVGPRAFPLYGNDTEIFNFRPCRYETEEVTIGDEEWGRIRTLFEILQSDDRFRFIQPSQVLELLSELQAGHRFQLESTQEPVPVKKQGKYNVTRWAVTGRDDAGINAACWRCFEALKEGSGSDEDWRELCYLWGSDFRTHITEKRWKIYHQRLEQFQGRVGHIPNPGLSVQVGRLISRLPSWSAPGLGFTVDRQGHYLTLESPSTKLQLNCRRGLAIEMLWFKEVSDQPLIGTLHHGYYDDISMGADYYSGHLVFEAPGQPKITDLGPVEPRIWELGSGDGVCVQARIDTPLGLIRKSMTIRVDGETTLNYELDWDHVPSGALRLGHITINPEGFDPESLFLETHNGGVRPERFRLGGEKVDHGRSVSFLVSASSALGVTEGCVRIGDQGRVLSIGVNQGLGYLVALMTCLPVGNSYFFRLSFSGAECDDTTRAGDFSSFPRQYELTLSAKRTAGALAKVLMESVEVETV